MKTCEGYDRDLALYVEGDLPSRDVAALEGHLEACPRSQALLRELEASQAVLKALASEPLPDGSLAGVRARVLTEARREATPAHAVPAWVWGSAAAAIASLAVVLGVAWSERTSERRPHVAGVTGAAPTSARKSLLPGSARPPEAPVTVATPSGPMAARSAPEPAPPRAPTPPGGRAARPESRPGPAGSAGPPPDSSLTAAEAAQLARAVVFLSRVERWSDVSDRRAEQTGEPLPTSAERSEAPRGATGATGTLVRWTTADPDVVIYWQLDSDGGES